MTLAKTLYDKLWEEHVVRREDDGTALLYIDRHLLHEVTSPQAFEGLTLAGRKVFRLAANLAVSDHNVPTTDRSQGIVDPISRLQVDTLDANCDRHGITQFKMNDLRQGIVHVIGPEQGATLPGMTVVCGDSHTSTHGAFAALAHGIGTSEVEHVLATQCLLAKKAKNLLVKVDGRLQPGCSAKDLVLAIIGRIGTAGGTVDEILDGDLLPGGVDREPAGPLDHEVHLGHHRFGETLHEVLSQPGTGGHVLDAVALADQRLDVPGGDVPRRGAHRRTLESSAHRRRETLVHGQGVLHAAAVDEHHVCPVVRQSLELQFPHRSLPPDSLM